MTKLGIAFITAVVLLPFIYCTDKNSSTYIPQSKLVENTGDFQSMTYEIGSGWIDWKRVVTVDNDKNFFATDTGGVLENKHYDTVSLKLTDNQYDTLITIIKAINIEELSTQYICRENCVTDQPTSSLAFNMDGYSKNIFIDPATNPPHELKTLINLIDTWYETFKTSE